MVQHDHCRELLEEIFNVCENYSCENTAICAQELANMTLQFGYCIYLSMDNQQFICDNEMHKKIIQNCLLEYMLQTCCWLPFLLKVQCKLHILLA